MKRLIVGTRASKLALIQAQQVITQLHQHWPDLEIVIEHISSRGDRITDEPLTGIGGDGVFMKELERALQEGKIDLAVHSLKDLPTVQPAGLHVAAMGPREDVRDVLVARTPLPGPADQSTILTIHRGLQIRIGTGSLRRAAQIRALFPTADILPLRGNVDTRLRKLDAGDYDAIILAAAGLHRLDVQEQIAGRLAYLPIESMLPAPGQGALAIEVRDEPEIHSLIAPLQDPALQAAVMAERAFMRHLGAGCYLPLAAYGEVVDETLTLQGLVISLDGQERIHVQQNMRWSGVTPPEGAGQLGVQLAEQALAEGAAAIITALNAQRLQESQHA